MSDNRYQYVIELFREDDSPVGHASVNVDWGPAEEAARFQAMRRGLLPANETGRIESIHPLWVRQGGEPHVDGVRVNITTSLGALGVEFGNGYFKSLVNQAASAFVEKGRLKAGDRFRYLVAAFHQHHESASGSGFKFSAEEIAPPIAIRDSSLAEMTRFAVPHGVLCDGDVPAFVPKLVLDEAAALSRQSLSKETGGILIGHLHRDAGVPEMFVEVTAQIHARHTEADLTKLTFTSQTWTEVQAAIDLRRQDEIMLGWWHSHPVREWCKDCAPERQRACRMASDFFSTHDQALHRAVFPRAYSIALVANDVPSGDVTFSAFGWRDGVLASRGFHITETRPQLADRK